MLQLLTRERPQNVALCLALLTGLAYGIALFGAPSSSSVQAFWRLPEGLMFGAPDIRTHVSGYWWFVLDQWRWPLLSLENANWPRGNAALFDVVPPMALLGKTLRTIFGLEVNLFPYWCVGSIALNATALAALVRALGQRSMLAAVLAGSLGAMAPAVHLRFGHTALLSHFVFIFALASYFSYERQASSSRNTFIGMLGLCFLAATIHLYLYVMTASVAAAAILHATVTRRLSLGMAVLLLVGVLVVALLPLWAFGLFDGWNLVNVQGATGKFSMNLVTPFWPQFSGLFGWTGIYWLTRGSIGATAGQFEGFNYLGGGTLLLVGLAGALHARRVKQVIYRYWTLGLVFVVLTAWAVSERVYVGPFLVASYEYPELLRNTVLAWFRCSGRFFWPVGWCICAMGIAGALSAFRSRAAVLIAALAIVMQWVDVAPLRAKVAAVIEAPAPTVFGSVAAAQIVAARIAAAGAVAVLPTIFCSSTGDDFDSPFNLAASEVQVMAGRANARMPWVFISRVPMPCSVELPEGLSSRGVIIALNDPIFDRYPGDLLSRKICEPFELGRICY